MTRRRFIMNAAGVLVPMASSGQFLMHRRRAFAQPFSGLVSTANLVEHWRLNEESGNRTGVHAGKVLTDNNTVTYSAGKIGNAASFNSANTEFLSRTDSALDGGPRDWSLTFWVYTPSTISTVGFVNQGNNRTTDFDYYVWATSAGVFTVRILNASATAVDVTPSGYSEDQWKFVFVSYTHGDPGTLASSINDGTKATAGVSGGSFNSTTSTFRLGASRQSDHYFTGQLDSLSFWTRVISNSEVTALYNSGNGLDY